MGDRFATPEDVRRHWRLEEGDPFRITETKDEAATRRSTVRSREERASELELVGEALVIARMHYPDSGRYRWGVFHAGTAQPVLMLDYEDAKPSDDGARARTLAEALDRWRDEAGEPFDWTSEGLVDRLRSPYGRGMLDQVLGRDPEARWAGSPSADAKTWETDDGLEYTYDRDGSTVSVYGPDGRMIARGAEYFDVRTKKSAYIGEMRDGRRIAGRRFGDFIEHVVWQQRVAQLEPAARDKLWIYYLDHRPIVHGTDRYDDDVKALLRSSGFTWSGYAKAYVTAGTTRPVARAQSVDRLARALYEQGRMVEIRADEDRLRGVFAPAAPAQASPAAAPTAETRPELAPQDLTDEQLAAELDRLNGKLRNAGFGSPGHSRLAEQIASLQEEHDRREIARLQDRPDPAGMTDEEIAAERETLAAGLDHRSVFWEGQRELETARRERDELLRVEQGRRVAVELENRTPVSQMTDGDLQAESAQLVRDSYRRPPEAAAVFDDRVAAVGKEIADRRLQAWGEQPPVEELDDTELTEALTALRGQRLSPSEFAGSYPAMERVEKAFRARRKALEDELRKRDEKALTALLETDGRIRLESYGYPGSTRQVVIDNRSYGEVLKLSSHWRARIWRGTDIVHDEVWQTDALRWLIEEYEKDPKTYDTRTWGPVVSLELPPAFVDQLTTRFGDPPPSGEVERYLLERLANSSRTQSRSNLVKRVMVHALDLPERTLPVLEQMGRYLADRLDEELDSNDRRTKDRAKRARPNVLRGLDAIREWMKTRGLEPLAAGNASAGTAREETEDEQRVREDSPPALGDVPAAGAGADGGPGAVLPGSGGAGAAADRGADPGDHGRSDAGDGPSAAGGQTAGGPADGPGTGLAGTRVPGAGGGQPGRGTAPLARFRPTSQDDLAPAGAHAKAAANLEAVRVLKRVQEEGRAATAVEQQVLARWSGWGSVPEIFAARPREDDPAFGPGGEREGGYAAAVARWESFADVRAPLRVLLSDAEWRAAAASTLSAHYTPPEITSALWQALADLGFDGGEVLEPGSGAGVSFGTAPETARLTGVEIDPTSAAISRLLAPDVTVLNESFADTVVPDGSFDAVIGNVPFARVALYDPKHNKGRHRIHNHFLIKSVALTRPGGVVALIASRHTLDAENDAARAELFEMADLLGAVRLPSRAFARSAGTDVVADVLILRRRMDGEEPLDRSWLTSQMRTVGKHQLPVNDYFAAHPEHVLGTLTSRMGAYGPEVSVDGDPDVAAALRTALRQITDRAARVQRRYQPHPDGPHRPKLRLRPAAELQDFAGRLSMDADGKLWQASGDGEQVAITLPPEQHAQLAALVELKHLVRELNELDRSGSDRALADAHRRRTKEAYERYVAAYGPLSRPRQQQHVTVQTDDGASVQGLTAWGYFLSDPQAYEVLALEMWEADTETVQVSEILDHAPAVRRSILGQHTDDPQQALDAVIAERGFVDLSHIAWMLQVDEDEALRRLGRSVFTDPLTGELVYSADYLSGDVRTKLEIARQAAKRDPAFKVNVAELERVQPREMLPGQFAIRLGAAWIPDELVQQFFREYLGDPHLTIQHSGNGNWHIRKGRGLSEENQIKHSAGGLAPLALLSRVLNGGPMTGRPPNDEEAARAVQVKADEWRDAFEAWVLDDSARAARAAEVYNRVMNNRTVRDFTGSRPSLAGLNPDFHPHEHQLAAAARMAHERCLVLAHEVGAGKTATMAIGMMAMRNTGQIDKPLVAVPNYLVEQWEKEVRRLFPAARILTLTSADLADGKRDRVLQYVRANSFDMVIMSHSLFDSLPLSPEFYEFYNSEELRRLEAQIHHERRRTGKSISLKKLEERRQQYEEELKAKAGVARIRGQVYLDDLGFDFFAIDEAHEYKNLAVRSKIPGARISGSARAQHLHAALEWARQNKPKGPIGCLATGTPLSNAIGELHSLIRLADPELLSALGIEEFDAFATMYGRMVERTEMTVDGKSFRSVERFASFHNVNSLLRQLWLPVVDYKDADDLGLPRPRIKGGEPELMLVPATDDQIRRMEDLGERYKAVHSGGVDKTEDNPLAINNDARVIALDPRLIDPEAEPGNKLRLLADRVAAKYHETKNNRYTYSTEDLRPHPVPGALQMVFLNHGTPSGNNRGGFNAYQEFKDLLVERGVPAEKIDFIHDAERADQRQKLALRANHGGCNVLIGSTQRMGKGLNAQNRLVALYHVDPDFRPADMKQKDGRALRQGNQHEEVEIVWVATERTFDSRMYGILATKASGFDQVYKARLADGSDEIQEVDDALVPFDEAMAIISGNPYLIAQEELRKRLRTLTLDQKNRATQRAIIFQKVQQIDKDIDGLARDIAQRGAVLPSLQPVLGKDFQITLKGVTYTKHKDAAAPLVQALADVAQALPEGRATTPNLTLGQLGGLDLVAAAYRDDQDVPHVRVSLDGLPGSLQRFTVAELGDLRGETLLRRLTKVISEAPDRQIEDEGNLAAKRATRHKLLAHSEQLRGQVPGLARVRERLRLVDALVSAQIEVNNAGEPEKGEPPAVTEQRKQAIARRDELQRQLDRFDATAPKEESSPETGEAPLNLDGDPKPLSSQQESEAAPPRAHAAGHGDPDGAVTDHLTALESPESPDAPAKEPDSSAAAHPATAAAPPAGHPGLTEEADETAGAAEPDTDRQTAPAPEPAGPQGTLQELADGFGGRVLFGHIGGPPPKPESFGGTGRQPTEQPDAQVGTPAKTAAVPEPPSAPEPADATAKEPVEQASAADGDEYGTADLYEEFGLPQPERVPATAPQDEPEPEPGADAAADVPDGQMTVEDMQPEAAPAGAAGQDAAATQEAAKDDGRERLTSANGRLTFTLLRVRDDASPEVIQGWQKTRAELAAAVEAHNKQMGQSPQERAEQLGRWRRSYKGGNRLEPFRPLPSLRLTRRPDAPGFTPKEYGIGSWVTWRDEESGQQVTGQVMSPGPASNTWYVSTDRTGHTGEYHVLVRSGKKATGYTYSIHGETGSTQDVRPADGPGEQLPLEDLPKADSIPARPVTSYADYVPKGGLAAVREPLPVTVGEMGPRFDPVEVAFDVTVDGIPFVVEVNQDDETLASLFVPRIEADGKVILRLDPVESRGAAIDACVRTARQAREFADKRLYGHYRLYDLDLSEDGVCEKCSRNYGENDVQQLYRLNGSDPLCLDHLAREYGVKHSEAAEVAAAKRIMAVRVPPKAQPDPEPAIEQPAAGQKSTEQEAVAASASAEPTEPHDITRDAIRPGDLITVTVNGRDVEWDTSWGPAPETLTITGTVFPGYRDYQHSATLLDAVIHDQDGNEMTAGNDVLVRRLPAQARVTPKEHRDDLRPEPRSVAQIRLGDLIAEGGARGETVTELRFASNAQGGVVITFFTRDVASGTPNSFTLALADELLVVPRERRLPQDVAEVFGRHSGHRQAAAEARRTYELHAAVTEVALRVWPDSTGPQEELRALDSAIGAINVSGKGVDAYLANAAAMEAAETAAAALFNAVDDDLLNRYLGLPLHRLRQHLDVQAHRLRADAAHLAQHADAAASADTALAASGRPGGQEQPAPEDQPTGRIQEGENVAPNTTGPADPQTEQLGLFGDLDPGAESSQEGPGRRPLPDGMRWAHQNDVRPGDVVRFDRDGVLQDAVLIRGTAPPHYLEYDTIDRGGLLGRWDSQDEYVVVVDRGPDRTAFNRYIRRFGDYMRNDLAEALARWEQRRNATGQQPGAGQPAPDAPEAVTDDAARDQLAVTEVTGAAGIQYRLYGSMEAGNVRFYIVRQSRGVTGTVDFSGTRDECLAYIESEAAVRSAAEAVDEDSEQQAAALAWLRDRQAGAPQQPEQNARTSGAAEEPTVPELDVVLLDVDVPPLDPAEPYATDAEAQADIDWLGEAFALWAALPAVQRYYEVDRQQRPDGDGDPTNPIVQLAEAYQDAERALREGPAGSPDDLVRQVHTVAVWSDALETAVSDDLRGPLRQVREAAQLLAARSRATVESFKAELTALTADSKEETADSDSAVAEPDPVEADAPTGDEPAAPKDGLQDVQEPAAAAVDTPLTEQPDGPDEQLPQADGDQQAPEPDPAPAPAGGDSTSDETAQDASEEPMTTPPIPETTGVPDEPVVIEEPPEPQRYVETVPLAWDPTYSVRLSGLDDRPADSGEVLQGDLVIATLHPGPEKGWFARLAAEDLPADVTYLANSPQDAAASAAVMYSVFTGAPAGPPLGAAPGDGPQQRVDALRAALRDTAVQHREAVAAAAARADAAFEQNPHFQELVGSLDGLAAAVSESYGSQQMTHHLDAVQRAVNSWGGSLPADPGAPERRQLAFPLARLFYDSRRLQDQVQATLAAVQAERAAARSQTAAAASGPSAGAVPAAPQTASAAAEARREASEPRSHEVPGSGSTEVPDSGGAEVPDSQSAEPAQEAPAAPAGAAGAPDGAGAPAGTVASGSDGPAPDTTVNGFRQGLEDTFQARQPETDTQSPGELPLWTGTGTSPSATGPLLDVRAEFQEVLEAFAEHVPPESGTAQDLLASLDADLAALQRLLADAITPPSPAAPPSPVQADTAAAKPGTETAASVSQQADAVNAALRGADAQADALQDLPEWEKIQTVRGAFTHLFRVIKQRAGEHVDRLLGDHRVGDFFRKLSLRTCEKIAQWAQAGAERLRRDGDRPGPQDGSHALPSAEALLRLEKATLSYSSPRGGRGGLPPAAAEVTLPQMRRLGEAPTRPGFSLAAARRRSTTTARRGAKKPSSSAEQAGHLRRSGLEQQQGRKPTQLG